MKLTETNDTRQTINLALKSLQHVMKSGSLTDKSRNVHQQLKLMRHAASGTVIPLVANYGFDQLFKVAQLHGVYWFAVFSLVPQQWITSLNKNFSIDRMRELETLLHTQFALHSESVTDWWFQTLEDFILPEVFGGLAAARLFVGVFGQEERLKDVYNYANKKISSEYPMFPLSIDGERGKMIDNDIVSHLRAKGYSYRTNLTKNPLSMNQEEAMVNSHEYFCRVLYRIMEMKPVEALKGLYDGSLIAFLVKRGKDRMKNKKRDAYAQKRHPHGRMIYLDDTWTE